MMGIMIDHAQQCEYEVTHTTEWWYILASLKYSTKTNLVLDLENTSSIYSLAEAGSICG